jgi:hypothetical protein
MADETLVHQPVGLSGRSLAVVLFAKYCLLVVYGVWAALVEIPTFVIVASAPFAVTWASLVTVFAFFAAVGTARSWLTGRGRLEQWATALFILTFCGYSSALVVRAFSSGDFDSMPLALIPIALCLSPGARYFSLVRHAHVQRKKAKEGEGD